MELEASERRSRLTLARRILSKDDDVTGEAIAGELGGLLARARRTITHDDGGEFARHETVADGSRGPTAGSVQTEAVSSCGGEILSRRFSLQVPAISLKSWKPFPCYKSGALAGNTSEKARYSRRRLAWEDGFLPKYPDIFPVSRDFVPETGSLQTASTASHTADPRRCSVAPRICAQVPQLVERTWSSRRAEPGQRWPGNNRRRSLFFIPAVAVRLTFAMALGCPLTFARRRARRLLLSAELTSERRAPPSRDIPIS